MNASHPSQAAYRRAVLAVAVSMAVGAGGDASAADLFQLSGATTDAGPAVTIQQSSDRLKDFISDLVAGSGQFQQLQNREFNAQLTYAGVENALFFNIAQVGPMWRAELTSPFNPNLVQRFFEAPSRQELENQVEAYLKQQGTDDLARFMAAMGQSSPAGVIDGNPNATTARMATESFMEYGMPPTDTVAEAEEKAATPDKAETQGDRLEVGMTADVGSFRSQGIEGQAFSWKPTIRYTLGKARRVRLEFSLPLNYTQIEGADQYRAGAQIGVSVLIVKRTKEQPWLWQVTPHGGAVVAGSVDLLAGGVVGSGGLTSYLSYRYQNWEFSMGNQASFHEGIRVDVEEYSFDPQLSQRIYKNGLKVGRSLGQRWYAEAYVIDTEFERAAYTSRYLTVGAGIGFRGLKKKGYVMLGGYADLGSDYDSANLRFGTGWKF